jgi:hypothetical protein
MFFLLFFIEFVTQYHSCFGSFCYLFIQTNVKIDFYFPCQVTLRTDSAAGVVEEAGGAGVPEAAAAPTVAAAPNP